MIRYSYLFLIFCVFLPMMNFCLLPLPRHLVPSQPLLVTNEVAFGLTFIKYSQPPKPLGFNYTHYIWFIGECLESPFSYYPFTVFFSKKSSLTIAEISSINSILHNHKSRLFGALTCTTAIQTFRNILHFSNPFSLYARLFPANNFTLISSRTDGFIIITVPKHTNLSLSSKG